MTKILFGSIVRNGENYLPRYFEQLNSLTNDYEIGLAITEGDSKDNTKYVIEDESKTCSFPIYQYEYNHSGNLYGSVNVPERWKNIANTWNYMLDQIDWLLPQYEYFCYMEADLIWNKETIDQLIWDCAFFDAVAPMSMLGNIFYDTWGHRALGHNFTNMYPYHPDFHKYTKYMPLTSAGSCIMMQPKVAKICRLNSEDAMIGHDIIRNKFTFVLDKTAYVHHP